MKLSALFLSLLPLVSAAPKKAPSTFSQREIFTPPSNANWTDPKVLYARSAQLKNGDLLATWENYSPEPPQVYFPIYHSKDNGYTWSELSRVQDQAQPTWGLRYQPFLYVLEKPLAGYKAGTVLLAGSSIPTDLSKTQIDLYASTDSGKTWKFVSHIAAGGEARPNNGLTPVWEPFLFQYENKLICFYSDQRDAKYGQKMVHQTTTDLKTWGPVVDDVKYPTYTDRPGMPTVQRLPNGKYIMAYEYGGGPSNSDSYQFPVHYKLASSPEKFDAEVGLPIKTPEGVIPTGSPYVVWSPVGGKNGTLIVSAHSSSDVYINKGLGESGDWVAVKTPELPAYTRHLRVLKDEGKLLIMGAGELPPAENNRVQVSVVDIKKLKA